MRFSIAPALFALLFTPVLATPKIPVPTPPTAAERVGVNDNRAGAGVLRNGVLTVHLEAREGDWRPDRDSDPGLTVRAFAEQGKRLLVPGPLIRVPEGTEIHAFVANTLARGTLVLHGLSPRGTATTAAADTIQIRSGATREVRFAAGAPGTYFYWGTIGEAPAGDRSTLDAELSGAFVIDPRGTPANARDRVFVLSFWSKEPIIAGGAGGPNGGAIDRFSILRFTINGKAWPNTERLSYAMGDTVRFRVINTSTAVHPMHLHGFYFNVDSRGDGMVDTAYDRAASPHRVVTERTAPSRTFTMTWVPERSGNWLFHCHDNFHVLRSRPFDGSPLPAEPMEHVMNHALEMMGGLVMGIEVRGREAPAVLARGDVRRKLRLVARVDSGGTPTEPSYGYALEDGATPSTSSSRASTPMLPGPTIVLKRGEPVSIMVVNQLREPTAVHWHGIELESYFDGVAGFAGNGRHIAPAIAPGDSFEARFTPPRAGTFMYHPHADEIRQQQAGLSGALLVVDGLPAANRAHEVVILVTVPRLAADAGTVLVNGSNTPAPLDLHAGERYRIRIIDIHTFRPSMIMRLMRDSSTVTWRAVAKDGMDLPADQATVRPAMQQMGNGETYDFEFTSMMPGDLRFTVASGAGVVLANMPVRIR
ncbi:MAG: multicopper oxidase domain-containing protein [bacterium]